MINSAFLRFIFSAFVINQTIARAYAAIDPPINSVDDATNLLCRFIGFFYVVVLAFSIVAILLAAFKYLTSGGDPTKVSGATKALTYGVVGIAVAIIAAGLPAFVASVLGQGSGEWQALYLDC